MHKVHVKPGEARTVRPGVQSRQLPPPPCPAEQGVPLVFAEHPAQAHQDRGEGHQSCQEDGLPDGRGRRSRRTVRGTSRSYPFPCNRSDLTMREEVQMNRERRSSIFGHRRSGLFLRRGASVRLGVSHNQVSEGDIGSESGKITTLGG